jgi:hypothetical protein
MKTSLKFKVEKVSSYIFSKKLNHETYKTDDVNLKHQTI